MRRLASTAVSMIILSVGLMATGAPASAGQSTCRVVNASTTVVYTNLANAIAGAQSGASLTMRGRCMGPFAIDKDLVITGKKTRLYGVPIIDGSFAGGALVVEVGSTVTLRSLTVTNGRARGSYPSNSGGGIRNEGTMTLENVKVTRNTATNGGGISNRGTMTLLGTTSVFANHAIVQNAGGIDVDGWTRAATLTMRGQSSVHDNTAAQRGGGIDVYTGGPGQTGTLYLYDTSRIYDNVSYQYGGGIYAFGGTQVTIADQAIVMGNSAGLDGGGVYAVCSANLTGVTAGVTVVANDPQNIVSC